MLTTLVLVIHAIIAIALVGVILLQRSEGGGLGIGGGGGGGGLMTARGAADLLTRTTTWLAAAFIGTSILLAVLAAQNAKPRDIDTSLAKTAPASAPATPAPAGAPPLLPGLPGAPAPAAPATPADSVPIAQ